MPTTCVRRSQNSWDRSTRAGQAGSAALGSRCHPFRRRAPGPRCDATTCGGCVVRRDGRRPVPRGNTAAATRSPGEQWGLGRDGARTDAERPWWPGPPQQLSPLGHGWTARSPIAPVPRTAGVRRPARCGRHTRRPEPRRPPPMPEARARRPVEETGVAVPEGWDLGRPVGVSGPGTASLMAHYGESAGQVPRCPRGRRALGVRSGTGSGRAVHSPEAASSAAVGAWAGGRSVGGAAGFGPVPRRRRGVLIPAVSRPRSSHL
jgi:hypothetical protein